jgi:hypothetical protein
MDSLGDWTRFIATARTNLRQLRVPDDLSPEWVERQLQPMRCSPNYPNLVAHNVLLARELCMVGSLFYELFTTSVHYAAAACEVALKERFLDSLAFPSKLTRKLRGVVEERIWTERPLVYEFVEALQQGWRLEKPHDGDFKPTLGYLIRWAAGSGVISKQQEEWFEHRRHMRNTIAHGHNMIVAPSWALGTLRQTTITLNTMFPDAETSASDERIRREREQQDQEWWREFEGMLRVEPSLTETEDDEETAGP